jgi:hypothetical protein
MNNYSSPHKEENSEATLDDDDMGDRNQNNATNVPSHNTRMSKMEENILQIMAMVNSMQYPMAEDQPKQKPKRNQVNEPTDTSVGEPTSKKANQNGTPMKTSPTLEQATVHHDP